MNKARILGHNFIVSYHPSSDLDGDMGDMIPADLSIRINAEQHDSVQASVLLHEIIEAINSLMRLNMRHHQIEMLEVGLIQVARDNPDLWCSISKNRIKNS